MDAPSLPPYMDALFAAGQCRGKNWTIVQCNSAFSRLLRQSAPDEKSPKAAAGLVGKPLGAVMAKAGLERVFNALKDSRPTIPGVFHCREFLYIFQWLPLEQANVSNARDLDDKAFVIHAVPLTIPDVSGPAGWRETNALFDSLHDGVWVINAEGITLRVNKALEEMTGIPARELEGRHVSQPMRQGRYQASMTLRALEEGRPVTMLDYYENGKRFLNTSTPVYDDAGNIWRVVACIRDMTALEKIQNTLVEREIDNRKQNIRLRRSEIAETDDLIGSSNALRKMVKEIAKAARSDAATVILGETGSGKTFAAQKIHALSSRRNEPFVAVNCGALPPTLIESELFGYEKGAFTNANSAGKVGLFEAAGSGVILLDEIAELPLHLQAKLLHVLDGQNFTRVGGVKPVRLKARVVAATNKPLEELTAKGEFREDLYYRINVLSVRIPPLRERVEDVAALSRRFLTEANRRNAARKVLLPEVFQLFARYPWPGNVRELRATIEYLSAMSEGTHITLRDLPDRMLRLDDDAQKDNDAMGLKAVLALKERELIARALKETGSTWKAAKRLKISQASVVRKARRYSIGVNAVVHDE